MHFTNLALILSDIPVPLFCAIAWICWVVFISRRRRTLPLPPGPTKLPFVGNLLDVPQTRPWVAYAEWSKRYNSDVVSMNLFSRPTVVLNSAKAAFDLMEKRSGIYSDKPHVVMDDLTGWGFNLGLMPYGERWRSTRRCFHQYFNQGAVQEYHPIQTREIHAFLRRTLVSPGNVDIRSINQVLAAIIVDITYGRRINDMNDEYIALVRKSVEGLTESRRPGFFWVDSFPLLKHVPAWVPGTSGKKLGNLYKPIVEAMRDRPFNAVKNEILAGTAAPSVAQKIIGKLEKFSSDANTYIAQELIARNALGVAYSGAVDTQFSAITSFILAMAISPAVQRKAQHELDHVVGPERLPDHSDIASLPYIQAIELETLRWIPVLPLAVPHSALIDDVYNGYQIPKGSIVMTNLWAMLHDPQDYPDPEAFNPDRFIKHGALDPNVRDPRTIVFGIGRRICAGRHLAHDNLLLLMASILHVFDIEPSLDAEGNPVRIQPEATTGLFSYPDSLPCTLEPRSARAEYLVRNTELL